MGDAAAHSSPERVYIKEREGEREGGREFCVGLLHVCVSVYDVCLCVVLFLCQACMHACNGMLTSADVCCRMLPYAVWCLYVAICVCQVYMHACVVYVRYVCMHVLVYVRYRLN